MPWVVTASPAVLPVNLDGEPGMADRFRFGVVPGAVGMIPLPTAPGPERSAERRCPARAALDRPR